MDPELLLLQHRPGTNSAGDLNGHGRAFKTAPVITGDAFLAASEELFPQRAVYGQIISQKCPGFPTNVESEKLYINTNTPFSAVVCGVQGSGKSHSTSVILESCLITDPRLGTLPEPLSAIVFHYDTTAGSGTVQPCEAAYVGALDPERGGHAVPPRVTVLVLPSTLNTMRRAYGRLGSHIQVEPLRFAPEDISGERLLSMMKVDSDVQMPLYMESIMGILRSMEDSFDYRRFRDELKAQSKTFNAGQRSMLNLRLTLLDSCLEGGNRLNRATSFFRRGHLVIVDLSSAFMDSSTACGLFEIILGLFIEARNDATGKLVVLDEAHKYLTNNASSSRLTDALLSVIRQQRHLGTRVLISTQEPTVVPPQFLDLCSFVIAHRFSSPTWLKHLEQHVSTVDSNWLQMVVTLQTGEALMFAPSGVGLPVLDSVPSDSDDERYDDFVKGKQPRRPSKAALATLGQGFLHVQSRLRITLDGGMSIMSLDETLRQPRVEPGEPLPTPVASTSGGETHLPSHVPAAANSLWTSTGLLAAAAFSTPSSNVSREHQVEPSFPVAALLSSAVPNYIAPRPSTTLPVSPNTNTNLPTPSSSSSLARPALPQLSTADLEAIEELRRTVVHLNANGNMTPTYTDIFATRRRFSSKFQGLKIAKLAEKASQANVIVLLPGKRVQLRHLGSGQGENDDWDISVLKRGLLQLYRDGKRAPTFAEINALRHQNSWTYNGDIEVLIGKAARKNVLTVQDGSTARLRIPSEYQGLIDVLSAQYSRTSLSRVNLTALTPLLKGKFTGKLKRFIEGAAEKGFIWMTGKGSTLSAELAI